MGTLFWLVQKKKSAMYRLTLGLPSPLQPSLKDGDLGLSDRGWEIPTELEMKPGENKDLSGV